MAKINASVVVFDIRNFSAHRYYLGLKTNRRANLLQELIVSLLERAVSLLKPHQDHGLNHTGDGFILVVGGEAHQRDTLNWISQFRGEASRLLKDYDAKLEKALPDVKAEIPSLDFGIGAHTGIVHEFDVQLFGASRTRCFLSSTINVASRVQQYTKEYGHRVICTRDLLKPFTKEAKCFSSSLGTSRLRGIPKSYELFSLKPLAKILTEAS
jgi:class 3 adenylate cyclase